MNAAIRAMRKAGRVQATCVTADNKRIAQRYLELAMAVCEKERPNHWAAQAAYFDGLKGKPMEVE